MINEAINGFDLVSMVNNGCRMLTNDVERINALNVFPVPDGDTGTNMKMTIEGGAINGTKNENENIGEMAGSMARAMVLSARGNSGVILSQFFKGLSIGLENKCSCNVKEFAEAMISGTKRSYSVVSNPTEGTILTVMREAGDLAIHDLKNTTSLEEYLESYLEYARIALEKTPDLLPVLKEAGVIDSGGAGFILVIEGMLKAVKGEKVEAMEAHTSHLDPTSVSFNADSELEYGYCTEFILQLQNKKVDPKSFDLEIINSYLNTIGNSIVSFKDDDIVKVHVHTFTPGDVLTEMQKYGEFITLKIENMNVSHNEHIEPKPINKRKHKKYGMVAVSSGDGMTNLFKDMGVDEVVMGGQTMNTSTRDFLEAFDRMSCDNILVFPNNSNIVMAANMARDSYKKANIYVVPTKSVVEGYSAISMANFESDNIDEILEIENSAIENVKTLEVTYSVRDTEINGIDIKKDDYICMYDHELIAASSNRLEALKEAFKRVPEIDDKQVVTLILGRDVPNLERDEIKKYITDLNPFIEVCDIEGNQDIYSYIIGIE